MIEEGTEQFERWVDIPQPLHFKVYIFNVTNPDEVLEGAIPKVEEIGPYIYRWDPYQYKSSVSNRLTNRFSFRQYRHKDVTHISSDKKFIEYRTIQTFFFDKEASAPLTENDELVVVNVQLNVSIYWFSSILAPWNDQLKHMQFKKFFKKR